MNSERLTQGRAYSGDPQFDNMTGRIVHQSEIVGITLDGWKVRHTYQVIDIGRSADIDAVDPDAQMQTEQLWREGKSDNTNAVAAVLAAGEARFLERHDQESSIIYVEYDMDEDGLGAGWRTWRIGRDYESSFDELDKRLQWWGPIMPPWDATQGDDAEGVSVYRMGK